MTQLHSRSALGDMLFNSSVQMSRQYLPKFQLRYQDGTREDECGNLSLAVEEMREIYVNPMFHDLRSQVDGIYQGSKLVRSAADLFAQFSREEDERILADEDDEAASDQDHRRDRAYFAASRWF